MEMEIPSLKKDFMSWMIRISHSESGVFIPQIYGFMVSLLMASGLKEIDMFYKALIEMLQE
jgi:hypothetical protein